MGGVIKYEDLGYDLNDCNLTEGNWRYDHSNSNQITKVFQGGGFFKGYAVHKTTRKGVIKFFIIEGDQNGFKILLKTDSIGKVEAKLKDIMLSDFRSSSFNHK